MKDRAGHGDNETTRAVRGRRRTFGPVLAVLLLLSGGLPAADWPQWRGPNRDGISAETGWLAAWPQGGPAVLWRADVGSGYSAVSVASGRLFTLGNVEGFVKAGDVVWCLDAATGKEIWRHMYGSKPGAYPGPRATPTVDGDLVFTLSRHGDLLCLDAKDGKARWQKNVRADFGVKTEPNGWGLSCSPLVLGERLVLDFGKVLVLDKQSGALAFSMGEEKPAFSSPIAFVAAGKSHVTSFNTFGLVLHDLDNRKEVGRYAWEPKFAANALTPVVSEDKLFISAGYGKGCALLRLTPQGIEAVYENTNLSSECSSAVLYKGFLYGESGEQGQKGTLKCLDFATGKVRWEQGGYRVGGGLIVADGKIVHMRDRGELVVAEATPDAYRELARARVLDGTCWTLPVLANGRIYCRNIKGSLICLDVRSAP